ncbi:MAG: leucine--tRNA ligase [Actinobacteria bacterium]|nr:leucine--tRNA ligase [Actinomycetota bacterium]
MSTEFQPQAFEPRWRARWEADGLHRTPEPCARPTFYCLDFFPYPSGAGLSVGHMHNYVPSDVVSRFMRMRGCDVLHPMGWDAFGLPTENDAIRRGRHPIELTAAYTANYKRQMQLAGLSFDWAREITSSSPDYYRWTQWFFLLLYERGLAYRATGLQWWCPICGALANEEVNADGTDWRGHTNITKRTLTQWFFRITQYADALIEDLKDVDWPEPTVASQINWIGRSEGAEVVFTTAQGDELKVFTTRPDTLFGATFVVMAPEHPLVDRITESARRAAVEAYVRAARRTAEIDRTAIDRAKTGVFTGGYATNPVNGERLPIWVADYVVMAYGAGAIMAVPAHDSRDFAFAKAYGIEIRTVVAPPGWDGAPLAEAHLGDGVMVNSGAFNGLPAQAEGIPAITRWLKERGQGDFAVNYRMRDWLISRQRYWGTPIPIVHCAHCGEVPVPKDQLPVVLPHLVEINPDKLGGRSPLEAAEAWVNTTCPTCRRPARRETDTLGGFACSSWYFLRFCSPHEADRPFDPAAVRRWMPVDLYVGGAEHSVMHLLYARFWTKVMYDAGLVPFREPFQKLRHQGVILAQPGWVEHPALWVDSAGNAVVTRATGVRAYDAPSATGNEVGNYPKDAKLVLTGNRAQADGTDWVEFRSTRMSKSWSNVVTPDDVVARAGADALRGYILFMGPFDRTLPWSEQGLAGVSRWLARVWHLVLEQPPETPGGAPAPSPPAQIDADLRRRTHKLIRKVTEDVEALKFNTMIAALMEYTNFLIERGTPELRRTQTWSEAIDTLLVVLAPSACFMAEELWQRRGRAGSIHQQAWPVWDPALAADETIALVVQVNGKVRDKIPAPVGLDEAAARDLALQSPRVRQHVDGRPVRKVFYQPDRLINLVA